MGSPRGLEDHDGNGPVGLLLVVPEARVVLLVPLPEPVPLLRVGDPRSPAAQLGRQLNLPPSYLLIHRVTIGTIGVLCQLGGEAPFRSLMQQWQPGFAPPGTAQPPSRR